MLNVHLRNGETKWVDKNEARRLQGKGQVVCVLEMKYEDADVTENIHYCDIKNGFCDIQSLPAVS